MLSATPDPEGIVYAAARGCYSEDSSAEIYDDGVEMPTAEAFIRGVVNSGHLSVLEHVVYVFSIEGISRACSHQLVRHRVASYSQQSQRYVYFGDDGIVFYTNDVPLEEVEHIYVVPPAIAQDTETLEAFLTYCRTATFGYQHMVEELLEAGRTEEQAQEDARYLLPNAAKTNITVTMNARELRHFFNQRMCKRAQWEIRELAFEMYHECCANAPSLFQKCGASCMWDTCKEGKHSCGEPY